MSFDSEMQRRLAAGVTAGLLETTLLQPLDVTKTRLQLQGTRAFPTDSKHYTSIIDCITKTCKSEGCSSLWKGFTPPVLAEAPKKALKLITFNDFANTFKDQQFSQEASYALAGFGSGIVEALLLNPFEVIKINLQADRGTGSNKLTFLDTTTGIMKNNGIFLQGLNRGLFITMLKNGVFNSLYFGSYLTLKEHLTYGDSQLFNFLQTFANGFLSALLATVGSLPFDVVKTRMQVSPPHPCYDKYRSVASSIFAIVKQEGIGGLYKGLGARILRLGIGGAILITTYDTAYRMYQF